MSLEDNFHQAVEEWRVHCRKNSIHSMPQPYLDCNAYRQIVSMGPNVLPLIRKEYAKPQEVGDPGMLWCYAIKEIAPDFGLPVEEKDSRSPVERVAPRFVGLRVDEVQKATIRWLNENMHKYVPTQ